MGSWTALLGRIYLACFDSLVNKKFRAPNGSKRIHIPLQDYSKLGEVGAGGGIFV